MFDMGFLELMLIGVVGLLVLGPERLPTAARTVGLWLGKAKRMAGEITREVDRQLKADEMRERLRQEGDELGLDKIQQTVDGALAEANKFKSMVSRPAQSELDKIKAGSPPIANSGTPAEPETLPETMPETTPKTGQKPSSDQNQL